MDKFILSVDQGTSATKCVLIDNKGVIVAKGSSPLGETYPHAGWVDQDPEDVWNSVGLAAAACLKDRDPGSVDAVALSTQRESMLLWERKTGKPLSPLISWQDMRSVEECDRLRELGHGDTVRRLSGLPLDPMFSALKAKWLLDNLDPDRKRSRAGEVCLGTVDSFLLSRFAGNDHLTEAGNASRTQLLNVKQAKWDDELAEIFNIPLDALPRVVKSNGPFPAVRGVNGLRDGTPVLGVLGDSHAALFGHGAFRPGQFKATYGTGSSVMGLLDKVENTHPGICLTIGWDIDRPALAAEANIRSSGATIRWVANLFGLEPDEVAELAVKHAASGRDGAVIIPGFNGLGAPWWDRAATGLISGLTLDSRRDSLALGAVESIPNQITDVLEIIAEGGGAVSGLFADGGPTRNAFLMQLQADLSGVPVAVSSDAELSALGAAHVAGLGLGWWGLADLERLERPHVVYRPRMDKSKRQDVRNRWKSVLAKAKSA